MTASTAGRPEPRPRSHQRGDAHDCSLTLLGGFAVTCHGDPLPLPPIACRVVALIALHHGLLNRQQLAAELWPDASRGRAGSRVRNTLWQVRAACPTLVADDGVFLALGSGVVVDVTETLTLARRLADRLDDDPELAATVPDRLTAELLPRWTDDWVVTEREHLRGRSLVALEALAERLIDADRPLDALDAAYLALGADPFRETTVQVLMRAHLTLGNRVDALRAYRTFADRLSEELGAQIRPLAETSQILLDGFDARHASEGGEVLPLRPPAAG